MKMSEDRESQEPFKDICSNGDVVLLIGPRKVRLRVFSQCLSCASPVFRVMFGPHWSEGQGISQTSPKEIRLVEDDFDALYAICCVIHHRSDLVPRTFTGQEILQIAIEVDKYDLCTALRYAEAQWLQSTNTNDVMEMGCFLMAAFLFDSVKVFVERGLALLLHYVGPYTKLLDDSTLLQVLPARVMYALEDERNRMRATIAQLFISQMDYACSCGWGEDRKLDYKKLLFQYGPLKLIEVPVAEVIEATRTVSCKGEKRKCHNSFSPSGYHEPSVYTESIATKLKSIKTEARTNLHALWAAVSRPHLDPT